MVLVVDMVVVLVDMVVVGHLEEEVDEVEVVVMDEVRLEAVVMVLTKNIG